MNLNPTAWPGRGLQLFAKVFNSGVNNTTPVTAISEAPTSAPNLDIALLAKGNGATLAQVPDGTIANGDKRGTYAVDWQKSRGSVSQVAGGSYTVIGGGSSNRANSSYATVCGGSSNSAQDTYAFIGGGLSNTASGSYSCIGGGSYNNVTAFGASVLGGSFNTANGTYSAVLGGYLGTTRNITGYSVIPACSDPISVGGGGIIQSARLLMGRQTTNDTATVLTSTTSAAATTNQVVLPNNSAYSFSGEVIATITGGGDTARWTINGAIKRGANAASTTLVGTPTVTMTHTNAGAAAWVAAVTANTTLGCLTVTVTGAAATTIRWVAKIDTTEVTF